MHKQKMGETSIAASFEIKTRITYIEAESRPESDYYFFAYRIFITNKGKLPAQLMSRHWIITDGLGRTEEVRGAGVVGKQPHLMPGETFEYESACPIMTSHGSMKGSYQMMGPNGQSFEISIPEFYLIAPQSLH